METSGTKPRRVLITGASEGIGRAFAVELARQGHPVLAVARNEARLRELIAELPGPGHSYRVADLALREDLGKIADELRSGGFSLLVNNAGFGAYGRFEEVPLEQMEAILRVNCEAVVALSHAFLRAAKPGDALINVSSVLAFLPSPFHAVYAASKAFVTSLSEALWFEQKQRGVYVLGLCPGATQTHFQSRAGDATAVPPALVETPEQVVANALRALRSRRVPTTVSGWKNRMGVFATRVLSRKSVATLTGRARKT